MAVKRKTTESSANFYPAVVTTKLTNRMGFDSDLAVTADSDGRPAEGLLSSAITAAGTGHLLFGHCHEGFLENRV